MRSKDNCVLKISIFNMKSSIPFIPWMNPNEVVMFEELEYIVLWIRMKCMYAIE